MIDKAELRFLFVVFRQICTIILFNRISLKESFQRFYYERLRKADASIFDNDYFKDTSTALRETREQERTAQRTFTITSVLLILCVFGILDKFAFNGVTLELQKYSPFILLVYSATKLRLSVLKPTIATREAILTARSRLVASEDDADLYCLRFPIDFTPPFASILNINEPTSVGRKLMVRPATLIAIIIMFAYVILYGCLAVYMLFVPGIPLIIRIATVLIASTLELLSAIGYFVLEFGTRRNPGMLKEYLATVTRILNTNKNTS